MGLPYIASLHSLEAHNKVGAEDVFNALEYMVGPARIDQSRLTSDLNQLRELTKEKEIDDMDALFGAIISTEGTNNPRSADKILGLENSRNTPQDLVDRVEAFVTSVWEIRDNFLASEAAKQSLNPPFTVGADDMPHTTFEGERKEDYRAGRAARVLGVLTMDMEKEEFATLMYELIEPELSRRKSTFERYALNDGEHMAKWQEEKSNQQEAQRAMDEALEAIQEWETAIDRIEQFLNEWPNK